MAGVSGSERWRGIEPSGGGAVAVIRCYDCDGSRPALDRLEKAQFCCLLGTILEELASRCPLLNPQFRSISVRPIELVIFLILRDKGSGRSIRMQLLADIIDVGYCYVSNIFRNEQLTFMNGLRILS